MNLLRLFFEHLGKALALLTAFLVTAEYLAPGSVLPYMNVYLVGVLGLVLLAAAPGRPSENRFARLWPLVPTALVAGLFVINAFPSFSKTALALIFAFAALVIALIWTQTES